MFRGIKKLFNILGKNRTLDENEKELVLASFGSDIGNKLIEILNDGEEVDIVKLGEIVDIFITYKEKNINKNIIELEKKLMANIHELDGKISELSVKLDRFSKGEISYLGGKINSLNNEIKVLSKDVLNLHSKINDMKE